MSEDPNVTVNVEVIVEPAAPAEPTAEPAEDTSFWGLGAGKGILVVIFGGFAAIYALWWLAYGVLKIVDTVS
jgi:hypothetical protein